MATEPLYHSQLTSVHAGAHTAGTDPGAVGADHLWVVRSGSQPYPLKVRTAANDDWEDVGGAGAGAVLKDPTSGHVGIVASIDPAKILAVEGPMDVTTGDCIGLWTTLHLQGDGASPNMWGAFIQAVNENAVGTLSGVTALAAALSGITGSTTSNGAALALEYDGDDGSAATGLRLLHIKSPFVGTGATIVGNTGIKIESQTGTGISGTVWAIDAADQINSGSAFAVSGTKVVGAQGAAVANATGSGDVVAQLNALLARLRAHGLIAP